MSTLSTRQFRKEDFSKILELEPRFEDLLVAFNQLARSLEGIVNGGIGYSNLNARKATVNIGKNQVYPLALKSDVTGKAVGVRILGALKTTDKREGEPVGAALSIDWAWKDDGLLITGIPGLNSANTYTVTIEIVGE